ncbi:MAG: D-alanyl-D-alanine carboxypeptidase [Nitrospinae bacterium]|nr:D-alanyl-D-alanine carboxypeptidase [Nitrospinota bacterium]
MVRNGTVLLANESGKIIVDHNSNAFFVPASIVKILTSLVALEKWGSDHRFTTSVYAKENEVWLKGMGDPSLVSEELILIAQHLKKLGVQHINQLNLDASYFATEIDIPGTSGTNNPYDALNGALIVNFNSAFVGKQKNGTVYSAEPITPLTPLTTLKAKKLRSGQEERINLTMKQSESLQYVGELFLAICNKEGIDTHSATIQFSKAPERKPDYLHHNSQKLEQILKSLLKYSNNFIANQILLQLSKETPKTLSGAINQYREIVHKLFNEDLKGAQFFEASGLSRDNRITAQQMLNVLQKFKPYASLLSEKRGVLLKSGTLTGVYNYAGYIKTKQGLKPFVIMLSQSKNNRDEILTLLKKQ